jgi:hypothetical protein
VKHLSKTLKSSLRNLFPTRKDKSQFFILTVSTSSIAIMELGIAKIFSEIIVNKSETNSDLFILIGLFVFLSVLAKALTYFQRTRRISIFSNALGEEEGERNKNSWNLSLSLEFSNIIGHFFQLLLVFLFITFLSLEFSLIILIAVLLMLFVFGELFQRQEKFQEKVFKTRFTRYKVSGKNRVLARVKSGEIGSLVAGMVTLIVLLLLILFHSLDLISTADAIVSFFAVRLIGTNLTSLSQSLMRYTRALVYSSFGIGRLTSSSPNDEILD